MDRVAPSSAFLFAVFFRPKRRLNRARPFVLEVGKDAGPVADAALGSRQAALGLAELAFGITHPAATVSGDLWIFVHMRV